MATFVYKMTDVNSNLESVVCQGLRRILVPSVKKCNRDFNLKSHVTKTNCKPFAKQGLWSKFSFSLASTVFTGGPKISSAHWLILYTADRGYRHKSQIWNVFTGIHNNWKHWMDWRLAGKWMDERIDYKDYKWIERWQMGGWRMYERTQRFLKWLMIRWMNGWMEE